MSRFQFEDLLAYAAAVLESLGVPEADAHEVAASLVEADLRGIGSHGLLRLPVHARRIRAGAVKAKPNITVENRFPAVALVNGDNGLGPVVGTRAMETAIELAEKCGIGFVGVRASNHFGTAAHYVQKAIARGFIGSAVSNAPPNMAPHGGRVRFLGTNPIGIGVPAGKRRPLVFDASTAIAARGKIIAAAKKNATIPEGWAIDPDGNPTTDAHAALAGAVLPFAGAKGSGISFIIDILSGVLTGAAFALHLNTLEDLNSVQNVGHAFMALRTDVFLPAAEFARRMDEIIGMLKSSPAAPGVAEVLAPGEVEFEKECRNRAEGVPLADEVAEELRALGDAVRVDFPQSVKRAQ